MRSRQLVAERFKVDEPNQRDVLLSGTKLSGIHGLRFVAAMMVVVFHLRDVAQVAPPFAFDRSLSAGVMLFFILSAFSLMYSTSTYKNEQNWMGIFAAKRFFRIAPLFYFIMFVDIQLGITGPANAFDVTLSAMFVFNFFPNLQGSLVWAGWTVGVEMIFYAIMPVVIGVVRSLRSAIVFLILSMLIGLSTINSPSQFGLPMLFKYITFPCELQFFAAGLGAYFAFREFLKISSMRIAKLSTGLMVVVAAVGAWSLYETSYLSDLEYYFLSCLVLFIPLVIVQAWRPSWIFSNSFAKYWGERSYSIYLTHGVVLISGRPVWAFLVFHFGTIIGFWLVASLATALILIASWFTYRFIELPGMQFGSRLWSSMLMEKNHWIEAPTLVVGQDSSR